MARRNRFTQQPSSNNRQRRTLAPPAASSPAPPATSPAAPPAEQRADRFRERFQELQAAAERAQTEAEQADVREDVFRLSVEEYEWVERAVKAQRAVDQRLVNDQLLRAIAVHRVADRPDRFEPRLAKRRHRRYDDLTRPRAEIKRHMLK
jgi:hypothetical protein